VPWSRTSALPILRTDVTRNVTRNVTNSSVPTVGADGIRVTRNVTVTLVSSHGRGGQHSRHPASPERHPGTIRRHLGLVDDPNCWPECTAWSALPPGMRPIRGPMTSRVATR